MVQAFVDKLGALFQGEAKWYKLPKLLGLVRLVLIRNELREKNLHDTEDGPLTGPPCDGANTGVRMLDGTCNDLASTRMGAAGTRFGRNFPLEHVWPDEKRLLSPSPRKVSLDLMTREAFQPATILNLTAASWIQFMTHDWFNHGLDKSGKRVIEVPLDPGDPWPEHPMRVPRTPLDPTRSADSPKPPTFVNEVTHWWDASQIYGIDPTTAIKRRTGTDGKIWVGPDGKLPLDPELGVDLTGFNDNWWIGLSMLHGLFALEHNAICEPLKAEYRHLSDEEIYGLARLINAALLAKIHTVEWTPAILPHPVITKAMEINWSGLAGDELQDVLEVLDDSEILGGIVGSKVDHHTAPYSLTEEFVSVYRLHALMPDEICFRSLKDDTVLQTRSLAEVSGKRTRAVLDQLSMADLFYSFGVAYPGAVRLHNYPRTLQNLKRDNGEIFDLAAVDILRDRERGVPRYNQFRRLLHLAPVATFKELSDKPEWAAQIRAVYNDDIESVDLMVGLYAEPLPDGFGFSETAFRIFVLMASRRLKSDRFFTDDYRPEIYTEAGLDWIRRNDMGSVIKRHFPELGAALAGVKNAFAPWRRVSPS